MGLLKIIVIKTPRTELN